jgi:hypothetical protein
MEAYWDALPPKHADLSTLLSYSNACWGSQIGHDVANCTPLPLLKFHSMSGGIVFKRMEVFLVGWLKARSTLPLAPVRQRFGPLILLLKTLSISTIFVEVFWSLVFLFLMSIKLQLSTMTTTPVFDGRTTFIELCENSIRKWVQDQTISIQHVPGKTNPANIFTKEICNGVHFHWLRDSFVLDYLTF